MSGNDTVRRKRAAAPSCLRNIWRMIRKGVQRFSETGHAQTEI
jgi:hypothetical protein